MDYKKKYLKYKHKYLQLKALQSGGDCTVCPKIDSKNHKQLYGSDCKIKDEANPHKIAARFSVFDFFSEKITKGMCCTKYIDPKDKDKKIASFINQFYVDVGTFVPRKIINGIATGSDRAEKIKQYHTSIGYNSTTQVYDDFKKCIAYIEKGVPYVHENDFFIRGIYLLEKQLKDVAENLKNPNVIISPACSRLTVFNDLASAKDTWIKGSNFSLHRLLNLGKLTKKNHLINTKLINALNDANPDKQNKIDDIFGIKNNTIGKEKGCKIVVSRLAPQDYHRVHHPINGKIFYIDEIQGHDRSVQPGIVNHNDVYDINRRTNVWVYNPTIGIYVICLIGASCVGSIGLLQKTEDFNKLKESLKENVPEFIQEVLLNDDKYKLFSIDKCGENKTTAATDDANNSDKESEYFNKKRIVGREEIIKKFLTDGNNSNVGLLEQINLYQFGGSTAVLIIPDLQNKVKWCDKILAFSKMQKTSVETLVHVGEFLGSF